MTKKSNGKPKKRKIKWVAEKEDPAWTPFRRSRYFLDDKDQSPEMVVQNNIYAVAVYRHPVQNIGSIMHLAIARLDKKPVRKWEDLQRIKNMIAGKEVEGCELFPSEKRKLPSDKIHLWCLPPDQMFPFGFIDRIKPEDDDTESAENSSS
jgi:hypothetical protein